MNKNLKSFSAFYLASLISKNKIDPVEIIEYFLNNFTYADENQKRSFTKVMKKEALIEAESSWKRQKRKERLSFFDGVPIVWKDLIDIEGYPAFAGSKLIFKKRKNLIVKNAKIVKLAKKNGIISLAKTSTVEFAFGGLGLNKTYKLPSNVMFKNDYLVAGGSSTGSATSVFSGLSPMAVGTDTAGSIRIPAAWHSLVGFKPSSKKISTLGVLPLSKTYDSVGTICKSVKDTKILYNIISESKNEFISYDLKNIKIGCIENMNFSMLDDFSKGKIEELCNKISKLGIFLKTIKIQEFEELNSLVAVSGSLVNYEAWKFWKNEISKDISSLDPFVADRFLIGKKMKLNNAIFLNKQILKLKERVLSKFEDYDFLIIPTIAFKPPKILSLKTKEIYHHFNNLALNNTRAANMFDLCALSLPLFVEQRKWLSISIISKKNNEENLLAVAEKIESILR